MLDTDELNTELLIEVSFEAAHQLPWHPGKCRAVHGHSYRAQITISGVLNQHGIIADFSDVRETVHRSAIQDYDHQFLNDLLDNPTAERLAHDLTSRLLDAGLHVVEVVLWETQRSAVRVRTRPHVTTDS